MERRAARFAAHMLAAPEGCCIAVLPLDGFDTHFGQTGPGSRLARRLSALDGVLATLADGLAPCWSETVLMAVSEFGRSVGANAANGTEHGLATAVFLMGGAVQGGRVCAQWPGLAPGQLNGGALAATTDVRAAFKGVLRDHLGLSSSALENDVFPDSADIRPFADLVRWPLEGRH
jgi:uncharacterized protein (DUF1501 family)